MTIEVRACGEVLGMSEGEGQGLERSTCVTVEITGRPKKEEGGVL